MLIDVIGGGEEVGPVGGLKTSLESSNALAGPLSDGLGHLLNSPDDQGVGKKKAG